MSPGNETEIQSNLTSIQGTINLYYKTKGLGFGNPRSKQLQDFLKIQ